MHLRHPTRWWVDVLSGGFGLEGDRMIDDVSPRNYRDGGLLLAGVLLVAALAGTTGCGPIRSTQQIGKAEVALERARVAEAYKKAPYEFFSARYHVHKAKEEWGYSDFEASYDYADDAESSAESAMRKAEEDPWKDPIEGREKTYKLKSRETITVEPEEIREAEGISESDS